jgi:cbb3-type cytochrome oxidase maturation protein
VINLTWQLFYPSYLAADFKILLKGKAFCKNNKWLPVARDTENPSHMKIIFFLIAASLLLALGFLVAFFWAVRTGQYEDDYTPSVRILLDDKMAGLPLADSNPPQLADNQPTINDSNPGVRHSLTTTNQL